MTEIKDGPQTLKWEFTASLPGEYMAYIWHIEFREFEKEWRIIRAGTLKARVRFSGEATTRENARRILSAYIDKETHPPRLDTAKIEVPTPSGLLTAISSMGGNEYPGIEIQVDGQVIALIDCLACGGKEIIGRLYSRDCDDPLVRLEWESGLVEAGDGAPDNSAVFIPARQTTA